MTTAASRLACTRPVEGHLRMGTVTLEADQELLALAEEGWRVKRKLDEINEKIRQINEKIAAMCLPRFDGAGVIHIVTPKATCTVTRKDRVEIADPDALRRILGRRFPDLVREKISYAPERRLITLAEDEENVLAPDIRACLNLRTASPTLAYKAS